MLTKKQRAFTEAMVETGGDPTKSAMIAYNPKNRESARQMGYSLVRNPNIREYLYEEFEEEGATPRKAARNMSEGMDAVKPDIVTKDAIIPGGPDHATRYKYTKLFLEVADAFPKPVEYHVHTHMHKVLEDQLSELSFAQLQDAFDREMSTPDEDLTVSDDDS